MTKDLQSREDSAIASLESDLANNVTPTQDAVLVTEIGDLEEQDPSFGSRVDDTIELGRIHGSVVAGGPADPMAVVTELIEEMEAEDAEEDESGLPLDGSDDAGDED